MNEIAVFKNVNLGSVRVVERCGEPWFVAKDVLAALGYSEDYNASRALQSVPDEWKGVHRLHTLGGEQDMLTLSEQGLYFFLGRSDKPTALPYQKWIAGDVVPALRKHGTYSVTTAPTNPINMVKGDFIAAVEMAKAIGFDNNQAAFCANNAVKSIHGVDSLALMGISSLEAPTNDRYFTPTELGKMVGISGMTICPALSQYAQNCVWLVMVAEKEDCCIKEAPKSLWLLRALCRGRCFVSCYGSAICRFF